MRSVDLVNLAVIKNVINCYFGCIKFDLNEPKQFYDTKLGVEQVCSI